MFSTTTTSPVIQFGSLPLNTAVRKIQFLQAPPDLRSEQGTDPTLAVVWVRVPPLGGAQDTAQMRSLDVPEDVVNNIVDRVTRKCTIKSTKISNGFLVLELNTAAQATKVVGILGGQNGQTICGGSYKVFAMIAAADNPIVIAHLASTTNLLSKKRSDPWHERRRQQGGSTSSSGHGSPSASPAGSPAASSSARRR